ncbi:XPG domain containing-domain-containing protein [Lasiosphaeria hispida]|uniref:XPG domain containing-domain-containing protein n=1 Tax=Lasiosphaeria hispida TaxID=260671 RepID=A0AAJ0HIS0_9PEZI|nr:XPG domain containing-domain-containing protein [Lasiosphaeria hispida]
MGIPHLKRLMEPYAEKEPIRPSYVVIDGPALAYHILRVCSRKTLKTSPFEQPSYELLGKTTIAWLDQIGAYGLYVSAIYFDGFLPESKRAERMRRLIGTSKDLVKYHMANLTGVPGQRPTFEEKPVELFPKSWGGDARATPPAPSFLVPAIIDTLRRSAEFGPRTKLVPGEADGFCAENVRTNGGIVLTSDSDLLVHDLGPDGNVVFFADIDVDIDSERLIALQYRISKICKRLSLKSNNDFPRVAFKLLEDPYLSLEQAAEKARNTASDTDDSDRYLEFINDYNSPETAPNVGVEHGSGLDPRVSEIAFRCLPNTEIGTSGPTDRADQLASEDQSLAMFLPPLLDSPSRTSAWEASKDIRQLSYSLLRSARGTAIQSVSEFRRLQSPSFGTRVQVPPPSNIEEEASALLNSLAAIKTSVEKAEVLWVTLSIYQDVALTVSQGKNQPLSLELIGHCAAGMLDQGSWDFLHMLSQAQATYYSLRMLRQVIGFAVRDGGRDFPAAVSKLANVLSSLPPLSDFPCVANFADMLRDFSALGGLACLANLCNEYDNILPQIEALQKPLVPKGKRSKKRKSESRSQQSVRPRPSNPFGILRNQDV